MNLDADTFMQFDAEGALAGTVGEALHGVAIHLKNKFNSVEINSDLIESSCF